MESWGNLERTRACMAMATFLAARNRPQRIMEPDMSRRTTVEQLVMPSWRCSSKSFSSKVILARAGGVGDVGMLALEDRPAAEPRGSACVVGSPWRERALCKV